jgi:hypothetical protein
MMLNLLKISLLSFAAISCSTPGKNADSVVGDIEQPKINSPQYPNPTLVDNFEGKRASFWRSDSKSGDSAPWALAAPHNGRPAYKFLVKKGDNHTKSDRKTGLERSEIYLDQDKYSDDMKREVWYQFDVFIPLDFPFTATRVVIGQWKTFEGDQASYSPSISNRYQSGIFSVKIKTQPGEKEYSFPSFKQGVWNSLKYRIVLSTQDDGALDVWLNGSQVVQHRGPTAIIEGKHCFKMGIYRDPFEKDMSVYFSNFSRSFSP